jgi:hypothetical protein
MNHNLKVSSRYRMECWRQGQLAWAEDFDNIVVTVGKNILLDSTFKTGVTSPTWFVGLVDGGSAPTYAAGDTMASHAGWTEFTSYSEGTRSAYVSDAAISGGIMQNQVQKASFTISGNGTLAGGFMVNNSTKGGSTGTLFGEANFGAGNRAVLTNDVVLVTVTITVS